MGYYYWLQLVDRAEKSCWIPIMHRGSVLWQLSHPRLSGMWQFCCVHTACTPSLFVVWMLTFSVGLVFTGFWDTKAFCREGDNSQCEGAERNSQWAGEMHCWKRCVCALCLRYCTLSFGKSVVLSHLPFFCPCSTSAFTSFFKKCVSKQLKQLGQCR